jgi:succinoglycan biosynthesis protein ExoA
MLTISVIVPCYNEESTISLLLEAIDRQTFDHNQFEVIIADGLSQDKTRQVILAFQKTHPDLEIKLVDNPKKIIPAALNRAIESAQGKYIVRLDAHSMPYPDYLEKCIQDLEAGCGTNVGGIWEIQPGFKKNSNPTWIARGIVAATTHPLGVGDALYRYAAKAQTVDTVPFGAFERKLVDKIGYFDESLLTNEDYEFNVRIRQSGGKIWLNPAIRSVYFARPTLISLAQQYWRYGYWKGRMLLRLPGSLRWRQMLPPLFVAALISLTVLSFFIRWFGWLLLAQIGIYTFALLIVGLMISWRKKDILLAISSPLAMAVMHLTWGAGVWWSLITFVLKKGK